MISYSQETIEARVIAAERQKEYVLRMHRLISRCNQKGKVHFSTYCFSTRTRITTVYGRKNTVSYGRLKTVSRLRVRKQSSQDSTGTVTVFMPGTVTASPSVGARPHFQSVSSTSNWLRCYENACSVTLL